MCEMLTLVRLIATAGSSRIAVAEVLHAGRPLTQASGCLAVPNLVRALHTMEERSGKDLLVHCTKKRSWIHGVLCRTVLLLLTMTVHQQQAHTAAAHTWQTQHLPHRRLLLQSFRSAGELTLVFSPLYVNCRRHLSHVEQSGGPQRCGTASPHILQRCLSKALHGRWFWILSAQEHVLRPLASRCRCVACITHTPVGEGLSWSGDLVLLAR